MSKVSIEINGLKFGLDIDPELALELVQAMQTMWVASASMGALAPVVEARTGARKAFEAIALDIFRRARKSVTGIYDVEAHAAKEWADHVETTVGPIVKALKPI